MMHGSKYVIDTSNLKKMLAAKFCSSSTMKIRKLFGYKTLWRTNTAASSRERRTRAYVFGYNMLVKNFCIKLHPLSSTVTTLKIILIYV